MTRWPRLSPGALGATLLLLCLSGVDAGPARGQAAVDPGPSPRATCGPGSRPEGGLQGRVSAEDHASGRAAQGYTCNTELLGRFGSSGGYKVERYTDAAGHDCAYYDTTLLFPTDSASAGTDLTGVYVLDMADPAHPVRTATLSTPAMQSPHESLLVNQERGLLAAVVGNPFAGPGIIDIYDLTADCRNPVLKSSSPVGIIGHESGFAPDGNTFYASSLSTGQVTAVDVSDPSVPVTLWVGEYASHGLSVSADGKRAFFAARQDAGPNGEAGLIVLDVGQIQDRVTNPQPEVVSTLTWDNVTIPQNAIPVTIGGHPYVVEVDEFAGGPIPSSEPSAPVGAARIIDIADETKPRVASNLRLEVHMPEHRATVAGDPGADNPLQGYAGHYCSVPSRVDPGIVACSFILSGLRVFDIRDPLHPKETAYFNPAPEGGGTSYAMSSPAYVPERGEIWYSDGNSGFYAVRVTNGVWPFPSAAPAGGERPAAPNGVAGIAGRSGQGQGLPASGDGPSLGPLGAVLAAAIGIRRLGRRVSRRSSARHLPVEPLHR